jgi:hypothetical protein
MASASIQELNDTNYPDYRGVEGSNPIWGAFAFLDLHTCLTRDI